MRRVLIIVQNYYDIDPRVRREAEALIEHGYCVDVLALQPPNKAENRYSLNKVHVNTIKLGKKRAGKLRYIWEYIAFWFMAFLYLARNHHYDLIQVCTLPDCLIFATLIPKLIGCKVILDMHEVMPEFFMSKYHVPENHFMIRVLKWQERLSIKFADHVIVINEPIKKLLETRGLPTQKATVITNSVDEQLFTPLRDERRKSETFVFMYHGTLTHIYGLDIALQAFSMASVQMPNAEFHIVGEGPERTNLELQVEKSNIKEKVKFLGVYPQESIPAQLTQCDVGVLATRRDTFLDLSFSNKLPEYIVMEKPVIASRLKAIHHYFSEEAIAYFEPENATNLAEKMVELYNNPERRKRYSENALWEYSDIRWECMKQRYLEIVERMLDSK